MSDTSFWGKQKRSLLAAALVGASAMFGVGAAHGADYPTAAVNTTGLAVTDTEVTVGILHSVTGTMAKPAVDPRLFQAAVATLARDAAKGVGRDLLHKELEKLFPAMPAPKK